MKKQFNHVEKELLGRFGAMAGTTIMDPKSNIFANTATVSKNNTKKMKIALAGTGIRGRAWGSSIVRDYSDHVEFVGLCDNNPGRLETGREIIE